MEQTHIPHNDKRIMTIDTLLRKLRATADSEKERERMGLVRGKKQ